MTFSTLIFFLVTLALGGALGYGIFLMLNKGRSNTQISSTILLERIEKVFKAVLAEGYFTEIFDYRDNKQYLYLFNASKKALIIAKAKVLVGYDFKKMRFRLDEDRKTMVIEHFPPAEVLSIDTDYKFYDVDSGLLNRFNQDDYTALLNDAKKGMNDKALSSDLPRIASNQVQFMMYQLTNTMGWKLDMQMPEAEQKKLQDQQQYHELQADVKVLLPRQDLPSQDF